MDSEILALKDKSFVERSFHQIVKNAYFGIDCWICQDFILINFSLFLEPFAYYSRFAVIIIMAIIALILYIIMSVVNDKQSDEFNLSKCFTFSISGDGLSGAGL